MGNYLSTHEPVYRGRYEEFDVIVTLFYDPYRNLFEDKDGYIIYNILDYVTPGELRLFKDETKTRYFPHIFNGVIGFIEFIHPYFYNID